jgi:hypothetical protein
VPNATEFPACCCRQNTPPPDDGGSYACSMLPRWLARSRSAARLSHPSVIVAQISRSAGSAAVFANSAHRPAKARQSLGSNKALTTTLPPRELGRQQAVRLTSGRTVTKEAGAGHPLERGVTSELRLGSARHEDAGDRSGPRSGAFLVARKENPSLETGWGLGWGLECKGGTARLGYRLVAEVGRHWIDSEVAAPHACTPASLK